LLLLLLTGRQARKVELEVTSAAAAAAVAAAGAAAPKRQGVAAAAPADATAAIGAIVAADGLQHHGSSRGDGRTAGGLTRSEAAEGGGGSGPANAHAPAAAAELLRGETSEASEASAAAATISTAASHGDLVELGLDLALGPAVVSTAGGNGLGHQRRLLPLAGRVKGALRREEVADLRADRVAAALCVSALAAVGFLCALTSRDAHTWFDSTISISAHSGCLL
jgi:hypothetical protein